MARERENTAFFINQEHYRVLQDGIIDNEEKIRRPTHKGKMLVADHYNRKYRDQEVEIITLENVDQVPEFIEALKLVRVGDIKVGFVIPSKGQLEGHTTPAIYIKDEKGEDLIISDSLSQYPLFVSNDALKEYITRSDIRVSMEAEEVEGKVLYGKTGRQADDGSCIMESLVFLKDGLRLPNDILRSRITDREFAEESLGANIHLFRSPVDLMKTSQTSKFVESAGFAGADRLYTSDHTLSEKREKHRKVFNYKYTMRFDDAPLSDDVMPVSEAAYLHSKGRLIEDIVTTEYGGMTEEELDKIYYRASGKYILDEVAERSRPHHVAHAEDVAVDASVVVVTVEGASGVGAGAVAGSRAGAGVVDLAVSTDTSKELTKVGSLLHSVGTRVCDGVSVQDNSRKAKASNDRKKGGKDGCCIIS
jgi:hypothetical protein